MATKYVHTCDICKHERKLNELSNINISVGGIKVRGLYTRNDTIHIDICKDCLMDKGFIIEYSKEECNEVADKNRETIEERLMDILMDLGVSFEG